MGISSPNLAFARNQGAERSPRTSVRSCVTTEMAVVCWIPSAGTEVCHADTAGLQLGPLMSLSLWGLGEPGSACSTVPQHRCRRDPMEGAWWLQREAFKALSQTEARSTI